MLRLKSVTGSDGSTDHEAYWPKKPEYWPLGSRSIVIDDAFTDLDTLHHLSFEMPTADGGLR